LFFVALGLITLVLAAILDQRSLSHSAAANFGAKQHVWLLEKREHIKNAGKEWEASHDQELSISEEIYKESASANRFNAFSQW
jgi:hypothetical protein